MPRYLLETDVTASTEYHVAVAIAAKRFPEVAIEHCYTEHHRLGARVWWVCQAPSEAHVERWVAATRLSPLSLRHVDRVSPLSAPTRRTGQKRDRGRS